MLATTSADQTTKLWRTTTGELMAVNDLEMAIATSIQNETDQNRQCKIQVEIK
jgi:hypothetical protein